MSERFTRLFSLPSDLYAEGSPVVISAGALLKDNQTGKVLAQLKLQNIGPKHIKAVKVRISPLDTVNKPLGEEKVFEYLDLDVGRDEQFGQKSPLYLPDERARAFEASVEEVDFADNSIWTCSGTPWESLAPAVVFSSDPDLSKQYMLRFGEDAKYKISEQKGLWTCACGKLNSSDEEVCHSCGTQYKELKGLDFSVLSAEMNERLAEEKAAAEQQRTEEEAKMAEAKAKAKKTGKLAAIIAAAVVVIVVAIVVLIKVIIPNSNYNKAIALFNAGKYEEAIAAFEAMDGYKDSIYQIGVCEDAIVERDYQDAISLLVSGEYDTAYSEFSRLGDYSDSKTYALETQYQHAKSYYAEKDFENSNKIFEAISSYKDSAELIHEHSFKGAVTEEPTCTEPGVMTYTCGNDGCTNSYTEPIDPTGHSFEDSVSVEPKCEEEGVLLHTCTVCGHTETDSIAPTGHSYEDAITVAPSCEAGGVRTYTCANCGDSYTEDVPANGHSWVSATCTAPKTGRFRARAYHLGGKMQQMRSRFPKNDSYF